MHALQPIEDRVFGQRVAQRIERTCAIFSQRDIAVELSGTREYRVLCTCRFLGGVRITARRDQCTEYTEIVFVNETVLVDVHAAGDRVGYAEGISYESISHSHIAICPSVVTIEI